MSNLLIGLIGVALLVAISMQGASMVMQGATDATARSEAGATAQSLALVGRAAATQSMQDGASVLAHQYDTDLVASGNLRILPRSPSSSGATYRLYASADISSATIAADTVAIPLNTSAQRLCAAIQRLAVGSTTLTSHTLFGVTDISSYLTRSFGCFQVATGSGTMHLTGAVSGGYVAYLKL